MRRPALTVMATLVAAAAMALVPLAPAATATADATAVIAGSGTSYTLTWTAGGDEALRCMGLILLPGEVPTGATGPAGWLIRALPLPGDPQGRWVVHATQPPPGLAPGATLPIQFTMQGPLAPNAPREIRFSSTCVAGSDVVKQSSGPTAPPPPPPPPPKKTPCVCDSLDVQLDIRRVDERKALAFVEWELECTKGNGSCEGRLEVELATSAERANVRLQDIDPTPRRAKGGAWLVDCKGKCGRNHGRLTREERSFFLLPPLAEDLGPGGIGAVTLEVDRFCRRQLTTKRFRIAFNAGGVISKRRSDLNGNGVADGKEKKR